MSRRPAKEFRLLWYKPTHPAIHPGFRFGDFLIGGLEPRNAAALRKAVVDQTWPAGTIFEIDLTENGATEKLRCFYPQIRAWNPKIDRLPQPIPIRQPIPRSVHIDRFLDTIDGAFVDAYESGILDLLEHNRLRKQVSQILRGHFG